MITIIIIILRMGSCQSIPKKNIRKKNKSYIIKNKIHSIPAHKKKQIPKALKKLVWDTWVGPNIGCRKCLCCNHEEIRQIEFHCGHIKSESTGGETTVENLRPICAQCNLSMGSMDMFEFKNKYFK